MSVFIKRKKEDPILDLKEVITSIPPDYYDTVQPELQKDKEIRWRFFEINNKKYVEISIFEDGFRSYINKNGVQIMSFVPKEFDKYCTKTMFYYPQDDSDE